MSVAALERTARPRGPLERCVGDVARFLREDWGRRAVARAGSAGDGFDDLLSLDDVDRILTTTALRTPFFRLVAAGRRIPEDAYTKAGRTGSRDVTGIADPSKVAALFEEGATIVLQGVHRWSEPVTRFTRDLELQLGHACQVNAYVTPAGAQGLDAHDDPHDVFVLQAFGHKRWHVEAAPAESPRDAFEAEVVPGDTIYMPAGTRHAASAQDGVSGHLTVGIHVERWRNVLGGVWASIVDRVDGPVPAGWTEDPAGFAEALRDRLRAAATELELVDAAAATQDRVRRWLSGRPQLGRGWISERASAPSIDDATVLHRRAGAICRLQPRPERLIVLLGDRSLEMPGWLEPAMRWIARRETFPLRDLSDELPDAGSRAVLAARLVREGLLTTRTED